MIQVFNMDLALPPGIPTYKSAAGNCTRPDNIWRSNNPANLMQQQTHPMTTKGGSPPNRHHPRLVSFTRHSIPLP